MGGIKFYTENSSDKLKKNSLEKIPVYFQRKTEIFSGSVGMITTKSKRDSWNFIRNSKNVTKFRSVSTKLLKHDFKKSLDYLLKSLENLF